MTEQFQDIERRRAALAAARNAADDAIRVCAGTAWAVAEHDWPPNKDWLALKKEATELANVVYRRPVPSAEWTVNELADKTKATTGAAAVLLKRFDATAVKALLDRAGAALAGDVRDYQAILDTALLVGPDRGRVWDAAGAIAERLHVATRTAGDRTENAGPALTIFSQPPQHPSDGRERRAEVAVGLLELGGHLAAAKLRPVVADLSNASADRVQDFATNLRLAWSAGTVNKRMGELKAAQDWDALDRLARTFPVGVEAGSPDQPTGDDWRVAGQKRRNRDAEAFRAWLAGRPR